MLLVPSMWASMTFLPLSAFSWSLCQFMKGLLTKLFLSFLQCIGCWVSSKHNVYRILHLLKGCRPSVGTHWGIVTETLFGTDEEIALETAGLLIKWYFWPTGSLFVEEPNSSEVVEIFPISFISCCITGSKWCRVRLPSVFSGTGACVVSTFLLTVRNC